MRSLYNDIKDDLVKVNAEATCIDLKTAEPHKVLAVAKKVQSMSDKGT